MEKRTINEIQSYFRHDVLNKGNPELVVFNVSTDSRSYRPEELFIPLSGDNFDGHQFVPDILKKNAAAVIIEKKFWNSIKSNINSGVWVFGVDDTLDAYHEIARNYLNSLSGLKKVAVTGSSGKTTTKEIIRALLSTRYKTQANTGNLNNRFGVPKTALEINSNVEIAVFEMGMGAPGDIEKLAWIVQPDVACITSIGEAHIEFFDSIGGIALTKKGIFAYFNDNCYAVVNPEEPLYSILVDGIKGKIKPINKNIIKIIDNLGVNGYKLKVRDKEVIFSLGGGHNITNLCSGLTIAEIFGLSDDEIIQGIKSVEVPGMRNKIKEGEYTILLDCYNANPSSMRAALTYFDSLPLKEQDNKKIAVLADMLELGKNGDKMHHEMGEFIAEKCISLDYLFTYGNKGELIGKGALSKGFNPDRVYSFSKKDDLTRKLKNVIKKGDAILFKASRGMQLEEIAEQI